ncbi:quinon protein alcohol dehydrogenase-like superfamily [Kalaharituber pfeilii]|nr:quinon protein alcohol dehydrogenase-like superfamily [Kalaharituber pfeilii]
MCHRKLYRCPSCKAGVPSAVIYCANEKCRETVQTAIDRICRTCFSAHGTPMKGKEPANEHSKESRKEGNKDNQLPTAIFNISQNQLPRAPNAFSQAKPNETTNAQQAHLHPPLRLTLDSDLFALSTHPIERLLAVGESSGRVTVLGWPEEGENTEAGSDEDSWENDDDSDNKWFQKHWTTKRHKGSTRCLEFSADGHVLYSAGIDSLLKAASSATGQVISKTWLPGTTTSSLGPPATALLPLNPQHIILGTDAGKIHLLDTRTSNTQNNLTSAVVSTWTPEQPIDYVSSLTALPPGKKSTTGLSYHFLATGGVYLFHFDSRRPGKVLHASEDQEDEILCLEVVPEWPGSRNRSRKKADDSEDGKILTGFASGIVGIWNRGDYQGHYERINVAKSAPAGPAKKQKKKTIGTAAAVGGDSVDCIALLPEDFSPLINNLDAAQKKRQVTFWGRHVAVGTGDGRVKIVRTGGNPGIVGVYEHFPISDKEKEKIERRRKLEAAGVNVDEGDDEEESKEAVLAVCVTADGRLVSGGGGTVTMFFEQDEGEDKDGDDERDGDEDSDDSDDREGVTTGGKRSRGGASDSDSDDGWGSNSSEEGKKNKKEKRKKRKKGKKSVVPQRKNVIGSFTGLD